MKVLLVDADSKKGFPNLALMKLSAYHKNKGHNVDLIKGIPTSPPLFHYDKSYISEHLSKIYQQYHCQEVTMNDLQIHTIYTT